MTAEEANARAEVYQEASEHLSIGHLFETDIEKRQQRIVAKVLYREAIRWTGRARKIRAA